MAAEGAVPTAYFTVTSLCGETTGIYGLPLQRELKGFFYCHSEQTVEQSVEMVVIWEANHINQRPYLGCIVQPMTENFTYVTSSLMGWNRAHAASGDAQKTASTMSGNWIAKRQPPQKTFWYMSHYLTESGKFIRLIPTWLKNIMFCGVG